LLTHDLHVLDRVPSVCVVCKGWERPSQHPSQHVKSQLVDGRLEWQHGARHCIAISVDGWRWSFCWQTAWAVLLTGQGWSV